MEKIRIIPNAKYRIEKIPPDGGYGWIIGIGIALSVGCFYGMIISFGIMYGEFLKSINAETSAVAAVIGTSFGAMSCAGLFANILFHSISMRSVGLFGAIIFTMGSVLCIFVTSIRTLIFSFGILQGFGAGLMTPVIYGTFNFYFVKKRVLAMSLVQILKGIFVMLHPILVGYLMTEYGFRGTMAVMAAINTHCILALLAMHPIEWHYKINKIKIDVNERVPLMIPNVDNNGMPKQLSVHPIRPTIFNRIIHFLDLTLLKDAIYVNIVLGFSFTIFSDNMFNALLPIFLIEKGFLQADAAITVAIARSADMVARIALALISLIIPVKARSVALIGVFALIFVRIAILHTDDANMLKILVGTQNLFSTFIIVSIPLSFAEHLPGKRYANGYALFIFISGISVLLLSPIFGWIRDTTQSYVICFHSLSFLLSLCAIPWFIEFIWTRRRSSKKISQTNHS